MTLTIDRQIWMRGEDIDSELLRAKDGKRCCVGIYLAALGVPDEELDGNGEAGEVRSLPAEAGWLLTAEGARAPIATELYRANDDEDSEDRDKEDAITGIFWQQGITVEFIGAEA